MPINDNVCLKVSIHRLAMGKIWHKSLIKVMKAKNKIGFKLVITMGTEAPHSLTARDSWKWPRLFLPVLYSLLVQSIRTIGIFLLHKKLRKFKNVKSESTDRLTWLSS